MQSSCIGHPIIRRIIPKMTSRIIAFSKSSPLPPQSLLWVDFGLALVAFSTICILDSRTNLHVCISDLVSSYPIDNLVQQYAAQNWVYLLVLAPLHAIRLGPSCTLAVPNRAENIGDCPGISYWLPPISKSLPNAAIRTAAARWTAQIITEGSSWSPYF